MRGSGKLVRLCVLALLPMLATGYEADNSLIGITTEGDKAHPVGSQITFTNLKSSEPAIIWLDGFDEKTVKLHEDEDLTVLQHVSPLGGVELVYLELRNKRFSIVTTSAINVLTKTGATNITILRGTIK